MTTAPSPLLFRNASIIDGTTPNVREGHDVLVEAGLIKEVSDKPLKSSSARIIDLKGKSLLPGLIDCHVHVVAGIASLGLYKGIAHVYGVKVKGFPAWFMHRSYHMSRIPSYNRKVRVIADWTLAFMLRRETVALGQLHTPREEFTHVTPPTEHSADRTPVGAGVRG